MAEEPANEFKGKATEYSLFLYGILWHTFALGVLLVLNTGVEFGVRYFEPHGIEGTIFRVVQVLFGVGTIGPVAIGVVRDLWLEAIRARKKIEAEKR